MRRMSLVQMLAGCVLQFLLSRKASLQVDVLGRLDATERRMEERDCWTLLLNGKGKVRLLDGCFMFLDATDKNSRMLDGAGQRLLDAINKQTRWQRNAERRCRYGHGVVVAEKRRRGCWLHAGATLPPSLQFEF
ncbi:hypothetical protein SESBI_11460 [Sesbania bispinosa]|nr:hypothetical protein SESBI_11460 [Sesbania bispinosa]